MRIIRSEWHQVEKRFSLDIERDDIDGIYPESSEEENDQLWQQIIDNDIDFEELRYDAEIQDIYLDWDWMDEDDWWTDRKGGYEVTYEVEESPVLPPSNYEIIQQLRNEVNELRAQLGLEPEYDTRPTEERLADLKRAFDEELEKLTDDEDSLVEEIDYEESPKNEKK